MKISFEAFVVALLVVIVLTPLARKCAMAVGAVSRPGGRHVHLRVTPRLGGIAICGGFLAALATLYMLDPVAQRVLHTAGPRMLGLVAGGVALCGVGALDDARGMRASHKLGLQVLTAVFAYGCGFRIQAVHLPLFGDLPTVSICLPLTVVWFVGVINAVNLIDGLDGLAAGVVFFAASTSCVVAALSGDGLVALLSASIAGSVLGFLRYNFNPARIFMGDSGSYFLGYLVAATALMLSPHRASTAVPLAVPVIALAVPILDTLSTMTRRTLMRRSLFEADRGHIHHALLDMGFTQRRAVLTIYAVCGVLGFAAVGVALEHPLLVCSALAGASAALMALLHLAGYSQAAQTLLRRIAVRARQPEERLHVEAPAIVRAAGPVIAMPVPPASQPPKRADRAA